MVEVVDFFAFAGVLVSPFVTFGAVPSSGEKTGMI